MRGEPPHKKRTCRGSPRHKNAAKPSLRSAARSREPALCAYGEPVDERSEACRWHKPAVGIDGARIAINYQLSTL